MDIPLALNNIRIRSGLKGNKRKSSAFGHQTDVEGLSHVFIAFFENKYLAMVTLSFRGT